MSERPKYIVINENALCYRLNNGELVAGYSLCGVLAGSVLRGGPDPKNGTIAVGPDDKVRAATNADFDFFRVSPTGHLND